MLEKVVSKVLVVSTGADKPEKDRVFMQRYGLPFLSHPGLAIVLSILSYQVPSPGLV